MTYDPYGNLTSQTVTARGVLDGTGSRIQHVTTATPSADGYFIEKVTNPMGHEARKQSDPATGQPLYQQEIQGGPATTFAYDELGRPLSVLTTGTQQVNYRIDGCWPRGPLACDAGEVLARQTTQVGTPTKTEYLDLLDRVVRTSSPSLDGRLVVTEVAYNERGLKLAEYEPRFEGAERYGRTYSGFDHRGRSTHRSLTRRSNLFPTGVSALPLETTYQYVGGKVDITADVGGPVPLTMSRTFDLEGRLVETTQRLSTPQPRDVRMRYVFGVGGLLTHVIDPGDNVLRSEYDAVGRKKWVADPDRGTWLYDWDGLGRVQFQTDARSKRTTFEYDKIGRPVLRRAGTANLATWRYDPPGAMGKLEHEEEYQGFKRDYTYDSQLRPTRVQTTIPTADTKQKPGNLTFTMEYGYDANYGRLKAVRYPTNVNLVGETVALMYDGRGFLVGEVGLDETLAEAKRYRQVTSLTERGQVADQWLGNCVREAAEYDASTGLALTLTATAQARAALPTTDLSVCGSPVGLVRQSTYKYDRFLNLATQTKNVSGLQAEERFSYDELQRLLSSGRCWGAGCTPAPADTDTYAFDDWGNITSKSDFGASYLYGDAARSVGQAGPHAVRQVTKVGGAVVSYVYDLNGNLLSGDGRSIDFDELDRPAHVTTGSITSEFRYAPGGGRYLQKVTGTGQPGFTPKTVYYLDKDYELTVWDTDSASAGQVEERSFIGGSVVTLTSVTAVNVKERRIRYLHVDRLGSVEETTEESLNPAPASFGSHGFDPWGKPRSGTWTANGDRLHPGGEPFDESNRGFTGHEQLDVHYLTHMNGRVYDYRLGRFLSVDPIISSPASTQSINPYSYIGNNPLSGVDPTGYAPRSLCEGTDGAGNCQTIQVAGPAERQYVLKEGGKVVASGTLSQVWGTLKSWFGGGESQGPTPANANTTIHGSPAQTAQRTDEHRNEWPYSVVGTDQWKQIWKDRTGSVVDLSPEWGKSTVSLAGKTWTLGTDPELDAAFIKHYVRIANQTEDSRVIGAATGVAGGVRLAGAAVDAVLARTATNTAREMSILREAAQGKGNFGLGTADSATAARVGNAWVGDGAKVASDGRTIVSADGLRQFRPPSWKPGLERVQANFESRLRPDGPWLSNGHLDVR